MLVLAFKRFLYAIPVLLVLTLVLFLAVKLVPGDIALVMAGERATAEKLAYIRESLHLNDPWYIQYGRYLFNLVTSFDLGQSLFHDRPIRELLALTVPATVELGLAAMCIAIPFGVGLGLLGALNRNTFIDKASTLIAITGVSMPIFWLALVLMYVFSMQLGWFPTSGRLGDELLFDPNTESMTRMYLVDGIIFGLRGDGWQLFGEALKYITLPAIALSTIPLAFICRMTRSCVLEILDQDYIRTAKAKGAGYYRVVFVHVMRNAGIQIITVIMLQAGTLFGGAVITETMFSWPGLGKTLVESIGSRDFPMVQSGTLFVGVCFVFFNLVADIINAVLDPRIQTSRS